MDRVRWRTVRVGTEHERADREHNEKLAEAILSDPAADNFAIASGRCYRACRCARHG